MVAKQNEPVGLIWARVAVMLLVEAERSAWAVGLQEQTVALELVSSGLA